MNFKSGCRYRHSTAKDLDILVRKIRHSDSKRVKLLINWVDMHTGHIRNFPGTGKYNGSVTIEIKVEDCKWWKQV